MKVEKYKGIKANSSKYITRLQNYIPEEDRRSTQLDLVLQLISVKTDLLKISAFSQLKK